MLKRTPNISPQEKRARRIRAAFLTCFALFLVITLLAIAYFGAAASRRNLPYRLETDGSHAGVLLFNISKALEQASRMTDEETLPPDVGLLSKAFYPVGQIYFWPEEDGSTSWIAFLPLLHPQRMYLGPLQESLHDSSKLWPVLSGDTPQREAAYFIDRDTGLVILSPGFEREYSIERGLTGFAEVAHYESEKSFLPVFLRRWVLEETNLAIDGSEKITIDWRERDQEVQIETTRGKHQQTTTLAYQPPFTFMKDE